MVGRYIRNSEKLNNSFECDYIKLGTSLSVSGSGKHHISKWFRYFKILWLTMYKSLVFKPQLVYITLTSSGIGFYKDAIVALLVKAMGKKVVYHLHNKGVRKQQSNFLDDLLYKLVFKNTDVILLSPLLYPDIQKYVPRGRVHYCNNGIPRIIEKVTMANEFPEEKEVEILCLSHLIRSKGIFKLLEACKLLKDKGLAFRCVFVGGEGDITEEMFHDKVQALGLEQQVLYAGRKYGDKKIAIYKQADIFVLYSYDDCFPLVILEAMQFSLPVIASNEGALSNIVEHGETGFVIEKDRPTMLSDVLALLIQDEKLRDQMGRKGHERYKENFTMEVFEQKFSHIMKEITNEQIA